MLRADDSGILADEELIDLRRTLSAEEYGQEYLCDFASPLVGAYYGAEMAQAEAEGRICRVEIDPALPVDTAWDLGIADATSIWAFQVLPSEIRIVGHYENHGLALPHYVQELNSRGWCGGIDWVPHDARQREQGTGKTRIEWLVELGRNPGLVPGHTVMDGINGVRKTLPRCRIDAEGCKHGIECLKQYRSNFDAKAQVFQTTPRHDWASHAADSMRYLCMAWRQQAKPDPKVAEPAFKPLHEWTIGEYVRATRKGERFADDDTDADRDWHENRARRYERI